ncbi:hypothetical protein HMPREF1143_0499 [Peptoanaerobacter stomatis]|uniref:Phage neck terminator protein gp12-like domain-containing protein n=1 Tax=Peptoanaerobacter stomatis TaxID=796937 RepID=J5WM48_9FIRM|nr:hypothetical protein [Peptoanaerobacter stomatis]EJU22972.1 hypothetical protein HMPREF1143_0499 [Peptoanaerobacter stomatis]
MELKKIRNIIVKQLHEHIKRPVVMLRQISDKPLKNDKIDYPFVGYNFISSYIKEKGQGVYKQFETSSSDTRFEKDIIDNLNLQAQFTMSFSAYADDSISAKQLALDALEYFRHIGYRQLLQENIVVIECMNISNRDIFEIDYYERREGFDVRFRTTHDIKTRIETIETYKVNRY